ncbi:MAG: ATP-binding protein [Desulfobacterales bacterium]|nr:ATP-binding protein [Desulfobacterales bacterium]
MAKGTATDNDMDGNPRGKDQSWYWRRTHIYQMEQENFSSRVLVDVFKESDEEERERSVHVSHYFWTVEANRRLINQQIEKENKGKKKDRIGNRSERSINDLNREDMDEIVEDLDVEPPEIEVPIHPYAAVFDLRRHLRLKIHVDYLSEYIYDTEISEKLILPKYLKDLVAMLIEHKGTTFNDIIEGKGGGAVVLLCGPPGTGKTLTAEVYAEAEQKGLYSVQCSQLGTDPEYLEDELLKIFTRTQRWGAVLLLDEADVYVRSRGSDLDQNAIVGVFLRVLEYQNNVLFLTTNRPDDVDDAIASRCVARLNYKIPNAEDQTKIWRVLADVSNVNIDDGIIRQIVVDNPDLSGRDVKNLLKLACLVSSNIEIPISPKVVKFVRQFKPTQSSTGSSDEIVELDLKLGGKPFRPRFTRGTV